MNEGIVEKVKRIFKNNADGKISTAKQKKQQSIIDLSNKLFDYMPQPCWMTEMSLAKALSVSKRQIRYAKTYLCITDRITINVQPNGNRDNPRHYIVKNCETVERVISTKSKPSIKWEIFNDLSPQDFSLLTLEEQLDIYTEMNLPFIPLWFPKFKYESKTKQELVYCGCKRKRNCPFIGKHPAIKYKHLDFSKKSTFREMKNQWTDRNNQFNIGFLTNDYAVIDVDCRHNGHLSLQVIEETYGAFPRSLVVRTGNGFHIYTSNEIATQIDALKSLNLSGIDIKSKGGYVVAPTSQHHSGVYYEWDSLSVPEPLPEEFVNDIHNAKDSKLSTMKNSVMVANDKLPNPFVSGYIIPDGERNSTLFRFASRERGKGREYHEILHFIQKLNDINCQFPLSDEELITIASSASQHTPNAFKELELAA